MGNIESRNYELVEEREIYHFGKIRVMRAIGHSKKLFFSQHYDFMIESDQEDEFRRHLETKNNHCPSLMQIKHVSIQTSGVCSNASKILVSF